MDNGTILWIVIGVAVLLVGHCCVARSGLVRDWCHELVLGVRFRWFPVSSGGDLGGGAVVPAVRPVLP